MKKKRSEAFYIGVTGHRSIPDDGRLHQSIRQVLFSILQDCGKRDVFLFSALAEGSDQLVAEIAQEFTEIKLHVPLPMAVEDYLAEFSSDDGKSSFQKLLSSATEIITLSHFSDHQHHYEALGKYLVDHADILLALWNGVYNQKKGGTGDVVRHALEAGIPIYWIYCENMGEEELFILQREKQIGDIEILINSESRNNCPESADRTKVDH